MSRNFEVIKDCVVEVWSSEPEKIENIEYRKGDLIEVFSSEVDGDDVIVTDEDGLTMIIPIDSVSV